MPFVGRAGNLLDELLGEIGLERGDVFIANVLKSRPPGNRDPPPEEIEACKPYLFRQVELIEPKVICTLGNFATKLLTGAPAGHHAGARQPQQHELGGAPGAHLPALPSRPPALRTPRSLEELREDFADCRPCSPSPPLRRPARHPPRRRHRSPHRSWTFLVKGLAMIETCACF